LNRMRRKLLKELIRSILEIDSRREGSIRVFRRPVGVIEMSRLAVVLILVAVFALGTEASAQSSHEMTISAAISLKNAFEAIATVFQERNPGTKLLFNFGASGDLARQIEAGAPVDVFASAAQKDMDDLDHKGLVAPNSRKNFAGNAVVLIKPANSNIPVNSVEDLKKEEVGKIAIGNPRTVPAGRYAEEVLRYFNLWQSLKKKLIFAENVRQVLDYVTRDEVDAGLVYSTDARVRSKEVKVVMKLPASSHQPIVYPIGVIQGAKEKTLSRTFIDFVISTEGQRVLDKYGFIAVNPSM
jgi:molybdate transport system substrate-binding protein